MKRFRQVPGKHATLFTAPDQYTGWIHGAVLILGIDPGTRTGFVVINARDWIEDQLTIRRFGYVDVSDNERWAGDIEKIREVGSAMKEVITGIPVTPAVMNLKPVADIIAMAIETPVTGGKRIGGIMAKVFQGRLLQHLIDLSGGLYHTGLSEIASATSRAAVLQKGDRIEGQTKINVVKRVSERFDLDFSTVKGWNGPDRPGQMVEALADSVTVAMAFIKKSMTL